MLKMVVYYIRLQYKDKDIHIFLTKTSEEATETKVLLEELQILASTNLYETCLQR